MTMQISALFEPLRFICRTRQLQNVTCSSAQVTNALFGLKNANNLATLSAFHPNRRTRMDTMNSLIRTRSHQRSRTCRSKLSCTLAIVFAIVAQFDHALCQPASTPTTKPNFVFIVADDLGYGDLGSYGQKKIRTPNLDRMAAEGMRFTQHYSGNAVCAPSRCVLMTGLHPGHAFIRNNREVKPEGQHPIPGDTITLPKLLKGQGYVTGAFGKWGLGGPGSTGEPLKQGIDRFYGYNCQRRAHNYYPTNLWDNDRRVPLSNPDFAVPQKLPANADANDANSYAGYAGKDYAPDLIADQARQFIRQNKDRPFFLYFPTTVPHLALQVPEDSVAEYIGKWPETPYPGGKGYLPHRTPRAAYAAMITRLDREIGSLMALVAELGLDERTIFVFTSDNGPLYSNHGGTDCEFFQSAGSLNGRKGSLYEGGIRVPLIVRWKSHINAGVTSDRVTGFEDWLPTVLELAGATQATPKGIDGISFAATLRGKKQEPRPFLYREFPANGGYQAVRVGDWKGLREQMISVEKAGGGASRIQTKLYDLSKDPGETTDLAKEHPQVIANLEKLMREQHKASKEFPFAPLDRVP
jgi:arylsulfatase A